MNDKRNTNGSKYPFKQISSDVGKGFASLETLQTVSSGFWRIEAVRGTILPVLSVFHDVHSLFRWIPAGWTLRESEQYTWEVSISAYLVQESPEKT
jgi:hypothetical protein